MMNAFPDPSTVAQKLWLVHDIEGQSVAAQHSTQLPILQEPPFHVRIDASLSRSFADSAIPM
jgi:hypothetical protein